MDFLFLKKNSDSTRGTIYARIRKKDINRKYSIGYSISEDEWKTYQNKKYGEDTVVDSLGIRYEQLATILEFITYYFNTGYISENARKEIQKIKIEVLHGSTEREYILDDSTRFFDVYVKKYYDDFVQGKRLSQKRSNKVSKSYITKMKLFYYRLLEYQSDHCCHLTFEDINIAFRDKYVSWLTNKGYSLGTVSSETKYIHVIMISAYEEHITDFDIRSIDPFIIRSEPADNVFLTLKQIDYLFSLKLDTNSDLRNLIMANIKEEKERKECLGQITPWTVSRLRKYLDIFLVGLFTGQRASDYARINSNMLTMINDEWFIHLRQKKTGKDVYIPLDARAKTILDKYGGTLPKYCQSDMNVCLSQLCRFIGWNQNTGIERYIMNNKLSDKFYDMVSSHTARRSFVTNAYIAGIDIHSIMAVTGHFSEKVFKRYLKLGVEEKSFYAADDLDGFMKL